MPNSISKHVIGYLGPVIVGVLSIWFVGGLIYGINAWLLYGLIFGLGSVLFGEPSEFFEELRWSWSGLLSGLRGALRYGLVCIILYTYSIFLILICFLFILMPLGVLSKLSLGVENGLYPGIGSIWKVILSVVSSTVMGLSPLLPTVLIGLPFLILLGVINIGLILGLIRSMTGNEISNRTIPNEGIRRSMRASLVSFLIGVLFAPLFFGWPFLSSNESVNARGLLALGLSGGLSLGLMKGGYTCLRHLMIRLVLCCTGSLPWNYIKFLDYATERILLQKIGGGYKFVHNQIMDYFSALDNRNVPVK